MSDRSTFVFDENHDHKLEVAYDQALMDFSRSLSRLSTRAKFEINDAIKYVEDTHIPYDCLSRLQKQLDATKEAERRLDEARRELIKYRDRRYGY